MDGTASPSSSSHGGGDVSDGDSSEVQLVAGVGAAAVLVPLSGATDSLPGRGSYDKPPLSYAALIAQAIKSSSEQRLTLSSIYQWIMETYPFYRNKDNAWQVSPPRHLARSPCMGVR
jgi:hypothetical protein